MENKGFTLIELLIVIGIISILAAVTLLVLNPAQMLRKARDSQRLQDLDTLASAISLYLAEVESPVLDEYGSCGSDIWCSHSGPAICTQATTSRDVDGTGWVPINFATTTLSTGAPFGSLPIDPTNDSTHLYMYACDSSNGAFELNAKLESTYYKDTKDFDGKDGGNDNDTYEKGNDPGLDLIGDW